jgi:hypothetical protein
LLTFIWQPTQQTFADDFLKHGLIIESRQRGNFLRGVELGNRRMRSEMAWVCLALTRSISRFGFARERRRLFRNH